MFETRKSKDAPKLDVKHNFNGDDAPSIVTHLKKFSTVIVSGTPFAKIGKDRDDHQIPVLSAFVNRIDIVALAYEEKIE